MYTCCTSIYTALMWAWNTWQLAYLLKERMGRQKVFLVLDNIWDSEIEEVEKYLSAGYHDGSMVLLVSRSLGFLERKPCIPLHHCIEMPNVDEGGAIDVFLHYVGRSRESIKSSDEWGIVKRCVKKCYFVSASRDAHHPLALKVIGMYVKGIKLDEWEERLEVDKFKWFKEDVHLVFPFYEKDMMY